MGINKNLSHCSKAWWIKEKGPPILKQHFELIFFLQQWLCSSKHLWLLVSLVHFCCYRVLASFIVVLHLFCIFKVVLWVFGFIYWWLAFLQVFVVVSITIYYLLHLLCICVVVLVVVLSSDYFVSLCFFLSVYGCIRLRPLEHLWFCHKKCEKRLGSVCDWPIHPSLWRHAKQSQRVCGKAIKLPVLQVVS